jgi:hypothetical protein
MATCKKCGEFFQPTADEERLLAQHKMEEICMDCALLAEDGQEDDWKPPPLRVSREKTDGTKLYRAERFGPEGKLLCFLALPPKPLYPAHRSLRKPRPHNLHVTFFTEREQRLTTEPRVVVHTNLETFRKTGQPFWVRKIPDFWDPHSGVGHIQVPNESVIDVIEDEGERKILLRDGGFVRLLYK